MLSNQPILVFDLDDTLFCELSYVRSGLKFVAGRAAPQLGVSQARLENAFLKALESDRNHIFNRGFEALGIGVSKSFIKKCVQMYRCHEPTIELSGEARSCLARFSGYRKFIVTDGNQTAQNKKIEALGLREQVEHAYITYRYGHKNQKPSPFCFNLIEKRTFSPPENIIYIADNPQKDFVGIKPLGFRTIQVLTGQHKDLKLPMEFQAESIITSLDELTECFLDDFVKKAL